MYHMRIVLLIGLCISIDGITQPGTLDLSFDPGTGTDVSVYSTQIQPDGKIFLGGDFHTYNGVVRNSVARLLEDGSLDSTFASGFGAPGCVYASALLPNGQILIGGSFTSYDGRPTGRIARLHGNGVLDTTFNPGVGADLEVRAILVQADGKILISGIFTSYSGTPCNRIARLHDDGSLDSTFNSQLELITSYAVLALALQSDGKLLIGGDFGVYAGVPRLRIARINDDGSLDTTFDPGAGASNSIQSILTIADGKILIGGRFQQYDGSNRMNIAMLNSDGSIYPGFDHGSELGYDPGPAAHGTFSLALQPDGKVLVGGRFRSPTGITGISRLNYDGSRDTTFNPSNGATLHAGQSSAYIYSVEIQSDGKIIIGGTMWEYDSVPRKGVARINGDNIITSAPISVSTGTSINPLSLWPNPNQGNSFHMSLKQVPSSNATIEVADTQGGTVHLERKTFGLSPCEAIVNLPNSLRPGVYYVRVFFEEGAFISRLTVTP